MSDPFVIVGGDAAGLSAASKFKREAPERDVIVFERGRWISYAHCGMPYYVKGEVDSLTDLLSLSPDDAADRGIDLRREHEVVAIDLGSKTVTVNTGQDRFDQPYAGLLVATGARAIAEPIEGSSLRGVFTMHSMDAAGALRAYLAAPGQADEIDGGYVDRVLVETYAAMDPPTTAAIVGGGYVGIEMAEALAAHDLDVHLFDRNDRPLVPFGPAVGDRVAETLEANGVSCHLGTAVGELVGDERVTGVRTTDGDRIDAGLVLVGIGVEPNADLVDATAVERGATGAIATDDYGRTTVEGVFAAGDCAEMRHAVTGEPDWVPLGLTANRAGRAIGQTIAGDPTPVGDIAGTAVVKAFELECGRTGLVDPNEAAAAGFGPVTETVTAASRSGYYPGAAETTVTLVADRDTGLLLGGSIAGEDRAAIRIDVLATALEAGLTVDELERLDLAYAPPFSPVWDPVLVAAKVLNGALGAT